MPNPPQLSPEQRMAALEKAAEVAAQRPEIKANPKKGMISLPTLLERAASEDLVGKMKVSAVLESLPCWEQFYRVYRYKKKTRSALTWMLSIQDVSAISVLSYGGWAQFLGRI